jgi:hypothetical protein
VIVALTSPPLLGLFARAGGWRGGARIVHWVMDVYPDALAAHGIARGHAYEALARVAREAYANAATVIALGPAMAERMQAHVGAGTRVAWVPLWMPPDLTPWPRGEPVPMRAARGWNDGRTTLMYSGNLGLGHRFEEFLAAAGRLGPEGPRWVFAGQGRARRTLQEFVARHPALPVEVREPVAPDALREHLASADVHLASVDARWSGVIAPSKLQAAFAVGKPVIFVGPRKDDLAGWLAAANAGWVVAEHGIDALTAAVRDAADAAAVHARGARARAYADEHFALARNAARVADLIEGRAA